MGIGFRAETSLFMSKGLLGRPCKGFLQGFAKGSIIL